ncbi:MAG: radical SAM protein [Candidatus Thermoplasmatota archaeon]|nr:radical SAM protein [Candidatus Thermoplasmatota archaeon]
MTRILLLDCYQDEPACLGVPPYLSPRVRYAAGAAAELGLDMSYMTIDQLRTGARPLLKNQPTKKNEKMNQWFSTFIHGKNNTEEISIVIVYAGVVIPGKYLRATPPSFKELSKIPVTIRTLARSHRGMPEKIILCGPVARFDMVSADGKKWERTLKDSYDHIIPDTPASVLLRLFSHGNPMDIMKEADKYGSLGSYIVSKHPDHPDPLICEIETYQGCIRYRSGGCKFCSQSEYGRPVFRKADDIISEMESLAREGITRYRLGGQSCFYSYGTEELGENEVPKPFPRQVINLLSGIRERVKKIEVLHIDNVNPAVVAGHPEESTKITKAIVKYCTPGNVAAMGLESADPEVHIKNNLNSTPEEALDAIRLINRYGSYRGDNGMPAFLPGINFLGGLKGENEDTYRQNLEFLRDVIREKLLARRINIRMVTAHGYGTVSRKMRSNYIKFRKSVRMEIDPVLMERVVPKGTIIKRVYLEKHDGKNTFGRQVGTYPVLVGFSYLLPLNRFVDPAVVSHSARSVTAVESPFPVNTCSLRALASLPGIGKKRAGRIAIARPITGNENLGDVLADAQLGEEIEKAVGGMDYSGFSL